MTSVYLHGSSINGIVRHHTYHHHHHHQRAYFYYDLFAVLPRMDNSFLTVLPTNPCAAPGDVFTSRISWELFALEERTFPFLFLLFGFDMFKCTPVFYTPQGQRSKTDTKSELRGKKITKKSSPAKAARKNIKPKLTSVIRRKIVYAMCFICNQSSTTQ